MKQNENANAVPENVIDKIKALLAKTTDNGCTQEEAESAMMMAQKLLAKYNLDMAEIEMRGQAREETIVREIYDLNPLQGRHDAQWVQKLFGVIAKHNFCKMIIYPRYSGEQYDQGAVEIWGTKINVDIVYYSVVQLMKKYQMAEKDAWRAYYGDTKRNSFRRGFFIGCVEGLNQKLYEMRKEIVRAAQDGTNNAMVALYDKKALAVQSAIDKFYGDSLKKSRATSSYSGHDGRSQGREVGRNTDINKGLGGSGSNRRLLN